MSRSVAFKFALAVFSAFLFASRTNASDRQKEINRLFESYNVKYHDKCGFHIIADYYGTPGDKFNIKSILQFRPVNDTSIVSQSGKFRIHFDTTEADSNQPFLYDSNGQVIPGSTMTFVDSVAKICDYVYQVEVDSLGFPPPPSDSGAGGGNEYDIYVQSLPTGEYSYTDYDPSQPIINRVNPTYAAWTVIRNEFQSTYTRGIPAIEVTIAHEFHHGILIGNYGLWQNDLWFYELTSTWMEQVVYPEVNDYYQYLSTFFDNVDRPFNLYEPDYAGYERCVFGIFVQNEYKEYGGVQVMKGIWQNMAREAVIPAIEDEFKSIGVDPSYAFQLFSQWNYFTSYRSQFASQYNVSTYPRASDYPLVKISGFDNLTSSGVDFSTTALSLTEHFYQIDAGTDTIGVAVVNDNFSAAANYDTTSYPNYDTTSYPFSVGISLGGSNCLRELTNGYCIFFVTADYTNWRLVPCITSENLAAKNDAVYPQPFNPSLQQELKIPYPFSDENSPSLSILKISGELVSKLDGDNNIAQYLGGKYFVWNGKDRNGKTVSSGIYIYVVTDGVKSAVGKIAVVKN